MPFVRIWVHAIWATKNRQSLLTDAIRNRVFTHIFENALAKGIFLDCINGYKDHIHCLFSLSSNQTLSKVMQQLKGESAYWINKHNLADGFFEWQDEYFAVSVSESVLPKARNYIQNQEKYHQTRTFDEEREWFLERYKATP